MAGKHLAAFAFQQVAADAGGDCCTLDQPGHLLFVQSLGADSLALPNHPQEQRAIGQPEPTSARLSGATTGEPRPISTSPPAASPLHHC